MINAVFERGATGLTGFRVSGHSGTANAGRDIVCAWVTSAVMQCANNITEIFEIGADVKVYENEVCLQLTEENDVGMRLIEGLKLHLQTIAEDYPRAVKVTQ
ncbi:MAG: ribosomal-processing cysteine protease Prp [Clostridia bacterium]|nr:ribosomal-processing cysteine protease Prp [Clostridia bacterium]